MIYKNKELLKEALKSKTVSQIALENNCGEMTIYRAIKKFKIQKEKDAWTNKEWLVEQLNAGKTQYQIAFENGCSEVTIRRWINKHNIEIAKPLYQDKEWLKEQTNYFSNAKEVAIHYNFTIETVRDWYTKTNIKFNREKDFNESYFKEINTERKAYWLGFLMADGFMHKTLKNFGIGLKTEDEYLLQTFLDDIQYNSNIRHQESGFGFPASYITICSTKMCKDLIYLGIIPKKSGRESFPQDLIPLELRKHFIRGFLDGDGWIITKNDNTERIATIGICSSCAGILFDISVFVENQLGINTYLERYCNREKHLWKIVIHGKYADIFLDWIYDGATIYLTRKKEKYDNARNAPAFVRKNAKNKNSVN